MHVSFDSFLIRGEPDRGSWSYGYDARRLASLTQVIDGAGYGLSTTHDEQDRALTMTYPNGDTLAYVYGDNGRPTMLWLNENVLLVNQATYTQLNQPATLPLGNGLVTQYHHYALDTSPPVANEWFGRLAQVATGSVQNETIGSYDAVGNPTGLSYSDHTSESFAAGYNEWDQLTAFGSLEGYGYIPAGQQYDIGTIQTKGASSYGYPAPGQPRPHAPTSVSGIGGYGYDANGNRASDATTTYAYDVENHLTQLTQGGTTVLQNTFDGDGARLVRVAGGVTTHFVGPWYEGDPASGIATAYYPFNGIPVAMKAGGTLSFLHRDHLGSLVSATDGSGNELGWARYFPFGALRLSGGTLPSDRLFTGQTRDLGDDRRYWFKARAYDATLGQFQSPDRTLPKYDQGAGNQKPPNGPSDPQTLDRYAYALNNPLRFVDPRGRAALDPTGSAPPLDPSVLTNSLGSFAAASWDQRIAWLQAFQSSNTLGGWFNNVLGILRYFRGSPTFSHSAQALEGDARVLWVIQEGLAAQQGNPVQSTSDPAARLAIADWRQFFTAYRTPQPTLTTLKADWGAAEQAGVNYADRYPAPFGSAYEAGLYNDFVWVGDRYRTAVLRNLPLPGDRQPDPRYDEGYVYQSAVLLEDTYLVSYLTGEATGTPSWPST